MVISLDQWELDLRIMELFDVSATSLDGGDLFDSDDLHMDTKYSITSLELREKFTFSPELNEREPDDEKPCHCNTESRLLRWSSHGIRGTCCVFQIASHNATKCRSS